MALENDALMSLLLAYSVILVALEIMSPGAFGHGISWRGHITHARSLLAKRLERMSVKRVSGIAEGEGGEEEEEGFRFMQSWLGYVGIMGSLMASPMVDSVSSASELLPCSAFSVVPSRLGEELDNLGCMTGLSMRCVGLLGRVNDLSRQCDRERFGLDDRLWLGWSPTSSTAEQALVLEQNMIKSLAQTARPCSHGRAGNMHVRDVKEMATINEAFHWAGLIQLRRRVLGKPTNDADVQLHVRKILICLEKLRTGTAAEIRCLFPIFTAGCEAADKDQRRRLLSRLESAERSGMKQASASDRKRRKILPIPGEQTLLTQVLLQVYHARLLLERVWTEGRPWEELIGDEFIA
ncbi:hypothetical protein UVI_02035330 [Ustilaginoidea virens]|uniref:C6 zinc finger domain protein n=1 Tax=Ustilaginoidea virens TaxID=1159556 RepID=A0A1B5KVF2_USTVR|nr:hypothetical protein UVI_02035330 [Ustilaginoidea virens]